MLCFECQIETNEERKKHCTLTDKLWDVFFIILINSAAGDKNSLSKRDKSA